jgi:hypothetical protein
MHIICMGKKNNGEKSADFVLDSGASNLSPVNSGRSTVDLYGFETFRKRSPVCYEFAIRVSAVMTVCGKTRPMRSPG